MKRGGQFREDSPFRCLSGCSGSYIDTVGINEEIRVTTYKGNVRTNKIQPKWELVGTHADRRTFIVNALSFGITPNIVMNS